MLKGLLQWASAAVALEAASGDPGIPWVNLLGGNVRLGYFIGAFVLMPRRLRQSWLAL